MTMAWWVLSMLTVVTGSRMHKGAHEPGSLARMLSG